MARGAFAVGNYLWSATTPITAAPFTVAGWIYRIDAGSGAVFILADTAAAVDYFLCYVAVGAQARLYSRNGGVSVFALQNGIVLNDWNHLAFVTSAANHRIVYVNGSPGAAETTACTPAGIDALAMGVKKVDTVALPYSGYAADFGLWNTALTQAQVTALYGGAEPAMIQRANLQAAWRCTPGDANETDILGSYDLTEVGAVPHQAHPPIRRAKIATPDRFGFAGVGL